ncbi:MAG: glucan biosynthesis protein G [Hyphomicrobiaceae bacterium]|nr:glucan biosynthesis protein G [Hyphomicrobiaceae bacterium]
MLRRTIDILSRGACCFQVEFPVSDAFLLSRRLLLSFGLSLPALSALGQPALARIRVEPSRGGDKPEPFAFDWAWLVERARSLAQDDHGEADTVDEAFSDLTYDQYRDIRFRSDAALFADAGRFRADLFHPGFIYRTPVDVFLVEDGTASALTYDRSLFDFGPLVPEIPADANPGYSGVRYRYPINRPDVLDEFAVFQGASYFRAVGRNTLYGLSARGLALRTADPRGEEFPAFTAFFLEKPEANSTSVVVMALLESPSATGAYRFTMRPGTATVMDVEAALFARTELTSVGLAPLTSMFLFNGVNRSQFDDFREAVHDSDGLQIQTGAGEWLFRPLNNPATLQVSGFQDNGPRGFGLVQRSRRFEDYQDLEAHYEKRPSAWVEPIGDWGPGEITLVEIPTDSETNDNIVAFWHPTRPIAEGAMFTLSYRLSWGEDFAPEDTLARVAHTRAGLSFDGQRQIFVLDFDRDVAAGVDAGPDVTGTAEIVNVVMKRNDVTGTTRLSFEFSSEDLDSAELRARIVDAQGAALSETWLFRWTA